MRSVGGKLRFLILVSAIFFTVYIYEFPVHRILAEFRYNIYRKENGILDEMIYSISFQKDYKQGGYFIIVVYKEKQEYRYEYQYYPIINKKDELKIHYMRCDIYNKNNHLVKQIQL